MTYQIEVEVRKDGKLISNQATSMKFEWSMEPEYMEAEMRDLHRKLKIWMPENEFYISAGIMGGIDPQIQTLSNFYSFYGPENRFVIHT